MSNEVKFKYGTRQEYENRLKSDGGVDSSALYFVTETITTVDDDKQTSEVEFGGTIYRGNDAIGTTCADHLKTTESIEVAGLSGQLGAGIANGDIIPAGTSLQEILVKLLSKELWPNSPKISKTGSISTTFNNPSFTIKDASGNNVPSVVEVGTVVTVSECKGTSSYVSSSTGREFSGFTYGYALALKGDRVSESNPSTVSVTNQSPMEGTYTLTRVISDFNSDNGTTKSDASAYGDCSISSINLVVKEAKGSVKFTMDGPGHQGTIAPTPAYYACSNLKNTDASLVVAAVDASVTVKDDDAAAGSLTKSVEGKYKYFIGFYSDSTFADKVYDSSNIRNTDMEESNWMNGTTINTKITVPAGTKGMYIAIPEKVDDTGATLEVKQVNTNAYVDEEMVENKRTLGLTCGGKHVKEYVIFTWSFPGGTTGSEPFEITSF